VQRQLADGHANGLQHSNARKRATDSKCVLICRCTVCFKASWLTGSTERLGDRAC
jgi:hypothetical protein